ncbi:hypothetical protein K502DRAFT_331369 [Neoconidiobolus thromboides FSU 785]|nr:hypothetical protein K502DRAFT_331369 [Neoconidiobolus thromboides FSU 785]
MTSVYPNMITPFELNDYHDDYVKSHPYLTARPILPKYNNHSVFSNPFDKMKPGLIDPTHENEELTLILNNENICINVEGTTLFCGFGSSQLLGANIMDRIHPNDRNKLRTKMSQITSRQNILSEMDPKTIISDDTYPEVDLHFLGSTNEYHLVTARLSHCNGSTCLNIKKFDLDILLRKSHKGSPTLFL